MPVGSSVKLAGRVVVAGLVGGTGSVMTCCDALVVGATAVVLCAEVAGAEGPGLELSGGAPSDAQPPCRAPTISKTASRAAVRTGREDADRCITISCSIRVSPRPSILGLDAQREPDSRLSGAMTDVPCPEGPPFLLHLTVWLHKMPHAGAAKTAVIPPVIVRCARGAQAPGYRPRLLAMTSLMTSEVPSPISSSLASRR